MSWGAKHLSLKPVAVPLDVDDPAVMEQPVQDRRGDDLISEELLPVDKALVRGDDGGCLLVSGRDELEEEVRLLGAHGKISGLVHDDQARGEVRFDLALAFLQLGDQGVHGGIEDLEAVAAGLDGKGNGKVRFSDARGSQKDHVLVLRQKGEIEEFHDRLLFQLGMEGEVVFLDGLPHGEPRHAHRHVDPSFLLCRNLLFEEPVEEREVGHLVPFGKGHDRIEDLVHTGKFEFHEVFFEPFAGQLLHDAPLPDAHTLREI